LTNASGGNRAKFGALTLAPWALESAGERDLSASGPNIFDGDDQRAAKELKRQAERYNSIS